MSDTRFYPGCTWVSDRPDCRAGSVIQGEPEAAAERFIRPSWYRRGRTFTCWTMTAPDESPRQHDIYLAVIDHRVECVHLPQVTELASA